MRQYYGKRVFDGIVIGSLIRIDDSIIYNDSEGLGFEKELIRFELAREKAINNYRNLIKKNKKNKVSILYSFIGILDDLDLIDTVKNNLQIKNISAEKAVEISCQELSKLLSSLDNEYLRERVNDIQEACNKIIYYLQEKTELNINKPVIIVAKDINVSTLMQIDKKNILGLVLENVSPNAHIAILARSLSIPTIASIEETIVFDENKNAILDCSNGVLIISPTDVIIEEYSNKIVEHKKRLEQAVKFKNIKPKTIDKKTIKVYSNISSIFEIDSVLDCNADGIGLFRSEYLFINNNTFPSEEEQFKNYVECILKMKNKPTIIRTMDIGSDKIAEYFNLPREKNPALGYRGIRLYKDFKDVFITQLKALYRASDFGNLQIMIPMITNIQEIEFIYECINEVKQNLCLRNISFNEKMKVGIMIETPAAAIICDELAKYVDFFSIGTNDLSQYTLAVDRENNKVSHISDYHHKSILRLIHHVTRVAKKNNILVGICGEMAREKDLLGFYIKCGVNEISVSSSYVLECKKNITEIDTSKIDFKDYI